MNQQELVEAVLREVKRVLAERGMATGTASTAAMTPAAPAARTVPAPVQSVSGTIDFTGKSVIVLKDMQGIAGGEVRVARGAVVTPLAVDYAREKGIAVIRVDRAPGKSENRQTESQVTVGLAVSSDYAAGGKAVRAYLESKGIAVREFTGARYDAAVTAMCDAVASGAMPFGVCVERTGMEAPIHANRGKAIRAVHCRDTFEARAARVDIGANVVVIGAQADPAGVIAGFTGME